MMAELVYQGLASCFFFPFYSEQKSSEKDNNQLVNIGTDNLSPSYRGAYKYSSAFLTISRIWNGRPFTFENGIASIKYFARIIVHS